jgi:hypothetical protein
VATIVTAKQGAETQSPQRGFHALAASDLHPLEDCYSRGLCTRLDVEVSPGRGRRASETTSSSKSPEGITGGIVSTTIRVVENCLCIFVFAFRHLSESHGDGSRALRLQSLWDILGWGSGKSEETWCCVGSESASTTIGSLGFVSSLCGALLFHIDVFSLGRRLALLLRWRAQLLLRLRWRWIKDGQIGDLLSWEKGEWVHMCRAIRQWF